MSDSSDFNIEAMLQTPPPMDEDDDVLQINEELLVEEINQEVKREPSATEGSSTKSSESSSTGSSAERSAGTSTSSYPPGNQLAQRPRVQPRGEPSKPRPPPGSGTGSSPDSASPPELMDSDDFTKKVLSIGKPKNNPNKANSPYKYDLSARAERVRARGSTHDWNRPSTSRAPPPPPPAAFVRPRPPQSTMASVLQGREDLLQLASREVAGAQAYPLLQAYLGNGSVPRTPRAASVAALWDAGRPRVGKIIFIASFNRDPSNNYTRAYQLPLINPRSIETILTRITEDNEAVVALTYSLHAERALLTPATTSYMLLNKQIIQQESSFIHITYLSTDDKHIGRDEAMIQPQKVDVSPGDREQEVILRIYIKLYGQAHRCNETPLDMENSINFLIWAKDERAKSSQTIRRMLNE